MKDIKAEIEELNERVAQLQKMARKPDVKSLERESTRKFNEMMKFVLEEMMPLARSEDRGPNKAEMLVRDAAEAVNEAGLAVDEAFEAIKKK